MPIPLWSVPRKPIRFLTATRLGQLLACCRRSVRFGPRLAPRPEGEPYFAIRLDVTVAVLLAGFGSELEEVTVAVFTIRVFPLRLTLTVNVSVTLAPLASVPTFQTTAPPAPTDGALAGAGDAL